MTDKLVGGRETAPAAGIDAGTKQDSTLSDRIRSRVSNELDPPSETQAQNGSKQNLSAKKTVKDMPAFDSSSMRRITLDSNTSYGMKVKRPDSDESGAYKVISAPEKVETKATSSELKLICQDCGAISTKARLTCESCGTYFSSTVQVTAFEKAKSRARQTQELSAMPTAAALTWRDLMLKRVIAKVIDLSIVLSGFSVIFLSYLSYANTVVAEDQAMAGLLGNVTFCLFPCLLVLTLLAYSASFEGSLAQATPGKIAMGIIVESKDGKELGFSSALSRAFVIYLPVILTVMAIWFTRLLNPALESLTIDKVWYLSQAVILVGVFGLIAYLVSFASMIGDRQLRTISDVLTGTVVKQR